MKAKWIIGLLKVPAAYFIIIYAYLHSWLWYSTTVFENEPLHPYDFIVVGGGSAGAVIASRLASNFSVLLLEAGGYAPSLASIPLISGVLPLTPTAWSFSTEPQNFGFDAAFEKRSNWIGGEVLGGSSTLNFLLYVRGNRLDYDNWAQMGNDGWSYEDVLPYFKKSENNAASALDDTYHGRSGELYVEDRAWKSELPKAFLAAGKHLGFNAADVNGNNQTGFAVPQVTTHLGSRWDTYSAFLNRAKNGRLKILRHAEVEKVLIDSSNRAWGVQYRRFDRTFKASANLEVILSAGAVNSPKILMLSGIGPKDHLQALGIDVKANLKVGDNLQDHVYVPYGPLIHNDSTASLVQPLDLTAWWSYIIHGSGQYSSNGIDGIAFKATRFSENSDWPDMQIHFLPYSAASDHGLCVRKVLNMEDKLWNELYYPLVHHDTASLFATLVRPKSRGWLKLRSANPRDPPIIDPQYYSHPDDLKVMLEGLKFAKAIIETPPLKEYITMHDLPHPYCNQHEEDSDAYFVCLIRHSSSTLYHPVGTCKMGPKTDPSAVVDSKLRIYGIQGLRVADASIIPVIPNGNTNAPVIMVGEKAADIILKNYKPKQVSDRSKEMLPPVVRRGEKEL